MASVTCKGMAFVALVHLGRVAFGGLTVEETYWQIPSGGGGASGLFTDASRWSRGAVPDTAISSDGATTNIQMAVFNAAPGSPYSVSFPSGAFATAAGLKVMLSDGMDITIDGSETVLSHLPAVWDRYPLLLGVGGTRVFCFHSSGYLSDGNGIVSNFRYRASQHGSVADIEVLTGAYDYGQSPWHLFSGGRIDGLDKLTLALSPGVETKTGDVYLEGVSAQTNLLRVCGAQMSVAGLFSALGRQEAEIREGGVLRADGGLTFGGTKFEVVQGSVLSVGGTMTLGGASELSATFADCFVTNTASSGNSFAIGGDATPLAAVDFTGATVRLSRSLLSGGLNGDRLTRVCALRSDFQRTGDTAYFRLRGNTVYAAVDSTNVWGCVEIGSGASSAMPELHVTGGTFRTDRTNSFIGREGSGVLTVDGDGVYETAGGSMYLGGNATGATTDFTGRSPAVTGTVTVAGRAAFRVQGSRLAVGQLPGAVGVLNVQDMALVEPNALAVGRWGTGFMNVSGGTVNVGDGFTVAGDASATPVVTDAAESVLRQTGGTINTKFDSYGLDVAVQAGRKGRVVFDGGVFNTGHVRGGVGQAAFEADGGTLKARQATETFLAGFDEAALGEKGLTVESDEALSIPQDFTDKAGAEGRGQLTLTGRGVTTLAMKTRAPSVVVAAGAGKVSFAAGAAHPQTLVVTNGATVALSGEVTFANLVVGDATSVGILEIDPTTRITVTGDLTIANLHFVFVGGAFAEGMQQEVIRCPNGASAASVAQFTAALTRAGLADGTACEFAHTESGGGVSLALRIVKAQDRVIRVDSGDDVHSTNVLFNASETLHAIVADGASLTLNGTVGYGFLEKSGAGVLALGSSENAFYPGLRLLEGVLAVSDPRALGGVGVQVYGKTSLVAGELCVAGDGAAVFPTALQIDGAAPSSLVEIRSDVAVTMPLPEVTQGAFRKRGPAPLVLEAADAADCGFSQTGSTPPVLAGLSDYAGFTVQEGELVLRGAAPNASVRIPSCDVEVGVPGEARAEGKVQPGLVVDSLDVSLGNRTLSLGSYVLNDATNHATGAVLVEANSFVTDPYLVVSNGATLAAGTFRYMRGETVNGHQHQRHLVGGAHVLVDGATVRAAQSYAVSSVGGNPSLAPVGATGLYGDQVFRNGASLEAARVAVSGTGRMSFTDSYLGGYAADGARTPTVIDHEANEVTSRWDFVRSEFCVSRVQRSLAGYQCRYYQEYNFEDTLWSCGDNDLLVGSTNVNMNIFVHGRGLRFAPPAGRTYTVIRKIRGDGGVVMDGPGTLVFGRSQYLNVEQADTIEAGLPPCSDSKTTGAAGYDPCTVAYAGATEVNGGTVDFGGLTVTGVRFTGTGGTVCHGTLAGGRTANTNLTYGVGLAFAGRYVIDLERTEETALADGDEVVVGHYAGVAPDLSRWRVRNLGARHLKGFLSAADGHIRATVRRVGGLVIIR